MKRKKRRSSYFSIPSNFKLEKSPIVIWGYDTSDKFVCRLEINGAGIAVFAGEKGRKQLTNVTWERLVEILGEA